MQSHVGIFSNQSYRFYTLIGMNGVSGPGPVHSIQYTVQSLNLAT